METITCAQHAGISGTLAIRIVNGLAAYAMGKVRRLYGHSHASVLVRVP